MCVLGTDHLMEITSELPEHWRRSIIPDNNDEVNVQSTAEIPEVKNDNDNTQEIMSAVRCEYSC